MRSRSICLSRLLGVAMAAALPRCAADPADHCAERAFPGAVIASERSGDGVVSFVGVQAEDEARGDQIQVVRHRDGSGCAAEQVDAYQEEGGAPALEASFVHSVQGEPNLFAIVSWPLWHAGVDTKGRFYSVYAYRDAGDALVPNEAVVRNRQLYGGVEGTLEGEPSTFEGTTEQGVVAMLERLGLE